MIRDARDWARTAYGAAAYQNALAKLSPEHRAIIDGPLLAGSWYPLEPWDRFLATMRAEARAKAGHSEQEFDRRNLREAGSQVVKSVYKFVLGLLSPESALDKVTVIFNRAYNEGKCEVVENGPGRGVLRYVGASPAFRTNISHHFLAGTTFVMELNGAKGLNARVTKDEIVNGKLVYEVTVTYDR